MQNSLSENVIGGALGGGRLGTKQRKDLMFSLHGRDDMFYYR